MARRNEAKSDTLMTLCRYIQECITHNLHHHITHPPEVTRGFVGHDIYFGRDPVERRFRPIAAQRCVLKNALPTVVTLKTYYLHSCETLSHTFVRNSLAHSFETHAFVRHSRIRSKLANSGVRFALVFQIAVLAKP